MHDMNTPPQPPPGPPQPPAPPIPPPAPPPQDPPRYGAGGLLGQFDWIEIGVLVLGVFGIWKIIHYYNGKAKIDKQNNTTVNDLKEKVDVMQRSFNGLVNRMQQRRM